jgi:Enoyl-(Acyl carrier protein) reductase
VTEATDIANAAVLLLSDQAAQITGVTIDVDGGNHLMVGWSPDPALGEPAFVTNPQVRARFDSPRLVPPDQPL